jgi:Tol biopolymer transport system component
MWAALGTVGVVAGALALALTPAPPVELASVAANGGFPNANSSGGVPSGDGSCVAYYTDATNILPVGPNGDSNGFTDVYVNDRSAMMTQRVSVAFNGQNANGPSMAQRFRPSIDKDCTCVAFSSDATNLVMGDTNGRTDVFVRDIAAQTTQLASVGMDGPANGASSFTSVSGDCSQVAFQSLASNLVPDDNNDVSDIFVFDRGSGSTTRVSVGPGGAEANGPSITPSFSADGHCVAFASAATNLISGLADTNNTLDIYVECDGVVTCRASVSSTGAEANDMSFLPALSADGHIVAFKSNATNLVPNDTNQAADVFVHDCTSGKTVRASVGDQGQQGNDNAIPPSISGDGRFVAFGSFASNLLVGVNTNGNSQVYVRDLVNNTTTLISSSPLGQPGNGGVPDLPPSISQDGSKVAFESLATNLVPLDLQGFLNVYIRENATVGPTPTPTGVPTGTATATTTVTATVTATMTPHISCHSDTDCPVGQVCGPDKICIPAPTPTPTIACTNDSNCPDGLKCVMGVCRDLSTPTVTPTPLPTCTMNSDCPDDTECRAGVCVPKRSCETQAMCRGIRETCLDGNCECGGDCNLDGVVFGSEITTMVNIEGGTAPLSDCPAGDINQDGEITAADVTLAVTNLGLGCPGEGSPLIFAFDRTNETRTLQVDDISGIPGQFLDFTISLTGGGDVTTAQVDILYPQNLLAVSLTEPVCTLDSRIPTSAGFTAEVTLPQVPANPPGMGRLRVAVVDQMPPVDTFDVGPVFHCHVRIQPAAAPGTTSQLTYVMSVHTPEIADNAGNKFNAVVAGGAIDIMESSTCMNDSMCPDGTSCKGGVCKPVIQCSGPMAGPSECLDNRQACVDNLCVCVGDCNNDGIVRSNEITIMINIINGVLPLDACLAGDFAGDGQIRSNDITKAIININEGCP